MQQSNEILQNGLTLSTSRRHDGFTLIELLVVIALISALVGFILPAIQTIREANAATEAESNLNKIAAAATAYHVQLGHFPASLSDVVIFCSQSPTVCNLDEDFDNGRAKGHTYYVTLKGGGLFTIQVEPDFLQGSISMLFELSRTSDGQFTSTLTRRATPGSDTARKVAMDRIFTEGAQTTAELFALSPNATLEARSFVETPTSRDQVFALIDKNTDGLISFKDLYVFPGAFAEVFDGIHPALQEPLRAFLNKVSLELKLQTMSEEMAENSFLGVGSFRSVDSGNTWFMLDGLCNLTNLHVSDKKVASDLCKTLTLADAAKQRGDLRTRDRLLTEFFNELERQAHITITRRNITMLVWVTAGFFEVLHPTS